MGKRVLVQRRGKGGFQFRAPSKGKVAPAKYPALPPGTTVSGVVRDIIHERGRIAPLAQVALDDGRVFYMPAVAGMYVGERVSIGEGAELRTGNVLPLSKIPEGTPVSNIELRPNDGGKVARAAGASAIVYSAKGGSVVLKLPSGRLVSVSGESRATIGVVAGSGAVEKPLLKAGASYHKMRSRGRKWPRVRGVAMSIWYHPHGGGRHQKPGHPTSVSRNAPPGRKVGNIAPRKTGRGKVRKERVEVK